MSFTKELVLILFSLFFIISCGAQPETSNKEKEKKYNEPIMVEKTQIAQYIRNVHEDRNGNLWMGTNGLGVAYFNGQSINYFSNKVGFNGQQITGISEDTEGNLWFSTDQGIVHCILDTGDHTKHKFINYSDTTIFKGQQFWSVYADSKSIIWAGAANGLYRFIDSFWQEFKLPLPEATSGDFITKATSWSISEDQSGNLWFSTNGFGAYKYDGKDFIQVSTKDGLCDDQVDQIIEDKKGRMWFATRYGGVCYWKNNQFHSFPDHGEITNGESCVVFEDNQGHIWFSVEGYGVYKYDGVTVKNYSVEQGLQVKAVQTIFQDSKDRLWAGGGGGLYRLDGDQFINVGIDGPWE